MTSKLLIIREQRIKKNSRHNKSIKGRKKRKREKFRDSENCRRRLLIDKLKLMLLELREPSRRVRDKHVKEKSLSKQRDKEFKPISRRPDRSNSKRKLLLWLNKLESRERTTCIKSKNKSKLSSKRERLRRIESKPLSTTLTRLEDKLVTMRTSRNKRDLTTLKRVEELERKSIWRGRRSRIFSRLKYRNSKTLVLITNIYTNSTRRLSHSDLLYWLVVHTRQYACIDRTIESISVTNEN